MSRPFCALAVVCLIMAAGALGTAARTTASTQSSTHPGGAVPTVSASLAPTPPDVSHRYSVVIRLTNNGTSDVVLFRPLDGSDYGWHLPHYRFTVRTTEGEELPLSGRCGVSGLWADTSWPESYAVTLAPGRSLELKMQPPQIQEPGTYSVRFTYEYRIDPKVQGRFPSPPAAWIGTAEAPEIEITFPAVRRGP